MSCEEGGSSGPPVSPRVTAALLSETPGDQAPGIRGGGGCFSLARARAALSVRTHPPCGGAVGAELGPWALHKGRLC